jgi:large subunit ribosomal protein L24
MSAAKIKKGDKVVILSGKDKGKRGEVIKSIPADSKVVVSGVNLIKRHRKPGAQGAGSIDTREAPLHVSKVAMEDPTTGKPTRVGFKVNEEGRKVRVAKRSGAVING